MAAAKQSIKQGSIPGAIVVVVVVVVYATMRLAPLLRCGDNRINPTFLPPY